MPNGDNIYPLVYNVGIDGAAVDLYPEMGFLYEGMYMRGPCSSEAVFCHSLPPISGRFSVVML